MTAFVALTSAPAVTLHGVSKSYDGSDQPIISGLDLEFPAGQFNVILGPSGCGKSTLLRLVAGLEEPGRGRIMIGEHDVTRLPPAQRQCAMVFQNYALYPHMNVRENIGYCLRLAGISRTERMSRITEIARTLGLQDLLERKPAQLSGGQRQRVAIGRALVRRPPVLLFDEPLCNLDSALRQDMRSELRRLHQQTGATVLYVTHDQTEAMTLADRVVVLARGRIEQIDTPHALYRQPESITVARLLGTPPMNLISVIHTDATGLVLGDGQRLPLQLPPRHPTASRLLLGIRPEALRIGPLGVQGLLQSIEELGSHRLLHCMLAGEKVVISHSGLLNMQPGQPVMLELPATDAVLFDTASGRRLPLPLIQDHPSPCL